MEQAGCADGEKCTWIEIDPPTNLGWVGCVPKGTVLEGGACTYGPANEITGYDDCAAGLVCASGRCERVCSVRADTCPSDHACAPYFELFVNSAPPVGVCEAACNPVTQERSDGAAYCGDASGRTGCYGMFDTEFACMTVPTAVSSVPAIYGQGGAPMYSDDFANGCAIGYAPLRRPSDETGAVICTAYCAPMPTSLEDPGGAGGAAPHACADAGAAAEECRYFWFRETWDAATPPKHPDGVGFCWRPEDYGEARCSTISVDDPDFATAGCAPFAVGN